MAFQTEKTLPQTKNNPDGGEKKISALSLLLIIPISFDLGV